MIAGLSGILIKKDFGRIIIDVGGVHYDVCMSANAIAQAPDIGGKISVHCHMNVREDAMQLFGFFDTKEHLVFKKLISVNGVGPKLAITILSGSSAESFRDAIIARDSKALQGIPGVGKKTSERLVLELKDKLTLDESATENSTKGNAKAEQYLDVVIALENLGYKKKSAEIAVKELVGEMSSRSEALLAGDVAELSPEQLLREALIRLNSFGKKKPNSSPTPLKLDLSVSEHVVMGETDRSAIL